MNEGTGPVASRDGQPASRPLVDGGVGIGQWESRDGQSSTRPRAAIDWGNGTKLYVTYDGEDAQVLGTDLIDWIADHPGYDVAIESSFESYDPIRKNECLDMAERQDVMLLTFSPRSTRARRREEAARSGGDEGSFKSDEADAKWIWRTAYGTSTHPKVPTRWTRPTAEELERRWLLNHALVSMRRSGYLNEDSQRLRAFLGYRLWAARHPIPEALFDGSQKQMLSYLVLPMGLVAEHVVDRGGTRKDYDRLVGAYGHGYPSIIRSNIYHHRVSALIEHGLERKEAMRRVRLASRRIFHEIRHAGETGPGCSRDGQEQPLSPAAGDQGLFPW